MRPFMKQCLGLPSPEIFQVLVLRAISCTACKNVCGRLQLQRCLGASDIEPGVTQIHGFLPIVHVGVVALLTKRCIGIVTGDGEGVIFRTVVVHFGASRVRILELVDDRVVWNIKEVLRYECFAVCLGLAIVAEVLAGVFGHFGGIGELGLDEIEVVLLPFAIDGVGSWEEVGASQG